MPLVRGTKRRNAPEDDEEASASPEPVTQRRRLSNQVEDAFDGDIGTQAVDSNTDVLVKKLVRLALASEYQRRPIRRADVSEKVLGTAGRQFKKVFEQAQHELQQVFGMQMVELPVKERITVQQKRAAAKSQSQNKTSAAWVLTSILPTEYRDPEILPPSAIPTDGEEGRYTALYTVIVSLISLSSGSLPDAKLERYLKRAHLEDSTPIDGYEKPAALLKRMEKDGYIVRVREQGPSGEEDISWVIGPRGKVEIGDNGVRGLTKAVYGDPEDADGEELERKIARSLGIGERPAERATQRQAEAGAEKRKRGRPRRSEQQEEEEEDDDDQSEDD